MSEEPKNSYINSASNILKSQTKLIEEKTGIPAKYIYIGLSICLISVCIGYLEKYISCLVGIVIPMICSIRTLESKDRDDTKQWLTYWIVFGTFSFIDLFTFGLFHYIPFYFLLKIIFLIWLFMPNTRGASKIYDTIISKFFKKYKTQIDDFDDQFYSKVNRLLGKAEENLPDKNILNQKINITNTNENLSTNHQENDTKEKEKFVIKNY